MLTCVKCGQVMKKITTFCPYCGFDQRLTLEEEKKVDQVKTNIDHLEKKSEPESNHSDKVLLKPIVEPKVVESITNEPDLPPNEATLKHNDITDTLSVDETPEQTTYKSANRYQLFNWIGVILFAGLGYLLSFSLFSVDTGNFAYDLNLVSVLNALFKYPDLLDNLYYGDLTFDVGITLITLMGAFIVLIIITLFGFVYNLFMLAKKHTAKVSMNVLCVLIFGLFLGILFIYENNFRFMLIGNDLALEIFILNGHTYVNNIIIYSVVVLFSYIIFAAIGNLSHKKIAKINQQTYPIQAAIWQLKYIIILLLFLLVGYIGYNDLLNTMEIIGSEGVIVNYNFSSLLTNMHEQVRNEGLILIFLILYVWGVFKVLYYAALPNNRNYFSQRRKYMYGFTLFLIILYGIDLVSRILEQFLENNGPIDFGIRPYGINPYWIGSVLILVITQILIYGIVFNMTKDGRPSVFYKYLSDKHFDYVKSQLKYSVKRAKRSTYIFAFINILFIVVIMLIYFEQVNIPVNLHSLFTGFLTIFFVFFIFYIIVYKLRSNELKLMVHIRNGGKFHDYGFFIIESLMQVEKIKINKDVKDESAASMIIQGIKLEEQGLYQDAKIMYEKALIHKHKDAGYCIGLLYEKGKLGQIDLEKAYSYYELSANMGNLDCAYEVGIAYLKGRHGFEINVSKGYQYLEQCVEANYFDAQKYLAYDAIDQQAFEKALKYLLSALNNEGSEKEDLSDLYNNLGRALMGIFADNEDDGYFIMGLEAFEKAHNLGDKDALKNIEIAKSYHSVEPNLRQSLKVNYNLNRLIHKNDQLTKEPKDIDEIRFNYHEGLQAIKSGQVETGATKLLYAANNDYYDANFMVAMLYSGEKNKFTEVNIDKALYYHTRAYMLAESDKDKSLNLNLMGIRLMNLHSKYKNQILFDYGLKCFETAMEKYQSTDAHNNYDKGVGMLPKINETPKQYLAKYDTNKLIDITNTIRKQGGTMVGYLTGQSVNKPTMKKDNISADLLDQFDDFVAMTNAFLLRIIIEGFFLTIAVGIVVYTLINPHIFYNGSDLGMYMLALFVAGLPGIRKSYWDAIKRDEKWNKFFGVAPYKAKIDLDRKTVTVKKNQDMFTIFFMTLMNILTSGISMPVEFFGHISFYKRCKNEIERIKSQYNV